MTTWGDPCPLCEHYHPPGPCPNRYEETDAEITAGTVGSVPADEEG